MKPAPSTRKGIASTATQDRRANSLSSPPNTRVPPATISAISEMERATGPVSDCATVLSGVSHGSPPPPPPAHAARLASRKNGASIVRLKSEFIRTSKWIRSDILDQVAALVVPGHHEQLPHFSASCQTWFLVDEDHQIDGFRDETLLRCAGRFGHQRLQPH